MTHCNRCVAETVSQKLVHLNKPVLYPHSILEHKFILSTKLNILFNDIIVNLLKEGQIPKGAQYLEQAETRTERTSEATLGQHEICE